MGNELTAEQKRRQRLLQESQPAPENEARPLMSGTIPLLHAEGRTEGFQRRCIVFNPQRQDLFARVGAHEQDLRKVLPKLAGLLVKLDIDIVEAKASQHMTRGMGIGTGHIPKTPPGEQFPRLRVHSAPSPPHNDRTKGTKLASLAFIDPPVPLSCLSHTCCSQINLYKVVLPHTPPPPK